MLGLCLLAVIIAAGLYVRSRKRRPEWDDLGSFTLSTSGSGAGGSVAMTHMTQMGTVMSDGMVRGRGSQHRRSDAQLLV